MPNSSVGQLVWSLAVRFALLRALLLLTLGRVVHGSTSPWKIDFDEANVWRCYINPDDCRVRFPWRTRARGWLVVG